MSLIAVTVIEVCVWDQSQPSLCTSSHNLCARPPAGWPGLHCSSKQSGGISAALTEAAFRTRQPPQPLPATHGGWHQCEGGLALLMVARQSLTAELPHSNSSVYLQENESGVLTTDICRACHGLAMAVSILMPPCTGGPGRAALYLLLRTHGSFLLGK